MKKFEFTGKGWEYFKIWIVNIALSIVTLGIYLPWAKVRNLRYFYANSVFDGANFEYHATGKQLLKGFLISVFFLIVYQLLAKFLPIVSIALLVVLFFVIPWIIWRSTSFKLRMSSYANVRFSFHGTLKQSYRVFSLYPLLLIILLFLPFLLALLVNFEYLNVAAWVQVVVLLASWLAAFLVKVLITQKSAQYLINHLKYGQGAFEVKLKFKPFLFISLKAILIALSALFLGGMLLLIFGGMQDFLSALKNPTPNQALVFIMVYVYSIGIYFFLSAYSTTQQRRYIYQNMTLDKSIKFASSLRTRQLFWLMLSNFLMVIVTFGLAFPFTKIRMANLIMNHTLIDAPEGFEDYVAQQQDKVSALGDQLGDAFDVNIDVAL
jgi:uncharacterized membrane protein YjgN (DUF898 family)